MLFELATSSDLFGPYLGIPTSLASGVVDYQYTMFNDRTDC